MKGFTVQVYDVLIDYDEGLTKNEIVEKSGIAWTTVHNALERNKILFHIDRWTVSEISWRWIPIYRVSVANEQDAPKPTMHPMLYWREQFLRTQERRAA